jgi:hypothetical protein
MCSCRKGWGGSTLRKKTLKNSNRKYAKIDYKINLSIGEET